MIPHLKRFDKHNNFCLLVGDLLATESGKIKNTKLYDARSFEMDIVTTSPFINIYEALSVFKIRLSNIWVTNFVF